MKRIAFIPIDNRPVCYQLPKQIVDLDNVYELLIPNREFMGSLTSQAYVPLIFDWLRNLKNIDIIVCSLDTIAYGGLISSRRTDDKVNIIKNRINKFIEIAIAHKASVYAFSSIMRISNNNINEEEKEYWDKYGTKIFEYSFNNHKSNDTDYKKYGIPKDIMDDYLQTRKRNFEINKYYIELAQKNIFNTLVLSKDDCAEYGFNVKEAEELKKLSKDAKNIFIKTGADEIPINLLSRAISEKKHVKIFPVYTNPESINKISRYEDITVKESVKSAIELSGGVVAANKAECDLIMIVNNFKNAQGELVMGIEEQGFGKKDIIIPDKPYFIADILNANGSDNSFINKLLSKSDLKEFYGYTAWNTTGNTLGSAVSSALIYYGAKLPNREAFDILQLTRLLDDWAYQANVRQKIKIKKVNLTNGIVKEMMHKYEERLLKAFAFKNMEIKYKFPWNRFFEIEINISKKYTNVAFVDILFYE